MRRLMFCTALLLTACNVAPPGFYNVPAREVSFKGSDFKIWVNVPHAHAVRTNPERSPSRYAMYGKFTHVIEDAASPCTVAWLRGDVVAVNVGLKCPGLDAPPTPEEIARAERANWDCDPPDPYTGEISCREY